MSAGQLLDASDGEENRPMFAGNCELTKNRLLSASSKLNETPEAGQGSCWTMNGAFRKVCHSSQKTINPLTYYLPLSGLLSLGQTSEWFSLLPVRVNPRCALSVPNSGNFQARLRRINHGQHLRLSQRYRTRISYRHYLRYASATRPKRNLILRSSPDESSVSGA